MPPSSGVSQQVTTTQVGRVRENIGESQSESPVDHEQDASRGRGPHPGTGYSVLCGLRQGSLCVGSRFHGDAAFHGDLLAAGGHHGRLRRHRPTPRSTDLGPVGVLAAAASTVRVAAEILGCHQTSGFGNGCAAAIGIAGGTVAPFHPPAFSQNCAVTTARDASHHRVRKGTRNDWRIQAKSGNTRSCGKN